MVEDTGWTDLSFPEGAVSLNLTMNNKRQNPGGDIIERKAISSAF